jgi:hypothetical protein
MKAAREEWLDWSGSGRVFVDEVEEDKCYEFYDRLLSSFKSPALDRAREYTP